MKKVYSKGTRLGALTAMLALFGGCAVGPDFQSPPPPEADGFTPEKITRIGGGAGKDELRLDRDASVPRKWWEAFKDKKLNALIEAAIERNPSLQAAEEAIKIAYFNAEAQKGAFLPTVVLGSSDSTVRQSFQQNFQNSAPTNPYGLFLKQLTVSYALDIWGGNRRSVEALEAQTDQQRYQLEAAYLALTANIANAAIQEATLRGQIAAVEEAIKIGREMLDLVNIRFLAGAISRSDVLVQQAALGQIMQLAPPLQKALAQQRNLMTALAGRYSTAEAPETFRLGALKLPHKLPLSLPAKFVRQRPDVRGAEANMHAAAAQIGVALAARLPNVTLSANPGFSAFSLAQQFTPGGWFYVLGGSAAHTVFDGAALLNKQRAAEAGLAQAEALYRQVVLSAFQNVADALRALQADTEAVKAAAYTEQAASENLVIVKEKVRSGSFSQFELLNAQQAYLNAKIATAQAEGNRLSDVVALFMALGGGWKDEHLRDLPPTGPAQPTAQQIETIETPVNASLLPRLFD